ncbi:MAG: hypothetical protein M3R03_06855 [Pseudomonadota bacterium]|nr:hypothetical protein [Pseudomonadota bacterium]
MIPLMLALALAQTPEVMTREPSPPSRWNLTLQATCNNKALLISDYAASVHSGAIPKMVFDGRPLQGPGIRQLITDLSTARAVYHFSVQCGRKGELTLRIYEGEALRGGTVRYRAALATIKNSKLDFYSGLKPAHAEDFWFR